MFCRSDILDTHIALNRTVPYLANLVYVLGKTEGKTLSTKDNN